MIDLLNGLDGRCPRMGFYALRCVIQTLGPEILLPVSSLTQHMKPRSAGFYLLHHELRDVIRNQNHFFRYLALEFLHADRVMSGPIVLQDRHALACHKVRLTITCMIKIISESRSQSG